MRNIESAGKFHLGLLITELQQETFVIPDFQREFEWDASDVNDLMRSIFLDYYIGTLLLWKASAENLKILRWVSLLRNGGSTWPEYPLSQQRPNIVCSSIKPEFTKLLTLARKSSNGVIKGFPFETFISIISFVSYNCR